MARSLCRSDRLQDFETTDHETSAADAIDYLESFDHVLITEFLGLQIPKLFDALGLERATQIPWRRERQFNSREEPSIMEKVELGEFDDSTKRHAVEANLADMIIYRHYLEKFLAENALEVSSAYHDLQRRQRLPYLESALSARPRPLRNIASAVRRYLASH